jgi:MHS family proline/betaine transporter-like MFS transporter
VVSGLILVTLTPIVGHLSDRFGRRPMILACALLNLVFDYPLFLLAVRGGTFGSLLAALVIAAVFQSLYTGVIPSILAEMFPTRVRYTGLSVSYGFAVVLFGGFAPLISTWLVAVTGNPLAPAFYIMIRAAILSGERAIGSRSSACASALSTRRWIVQATVLGIHRRPLPGDCIVLGNSKNTKRDQE